MLVQNNVNTPSFTALKINKAALEHLEKLPVTALRKIDDAGMEFMGYKYANMHIKENATPTVAMEWHDFEAPSPFQVKLSKAGDRLELSGQHIYDHPGRHKAGDPAMEYINFESKKIAKNFLQEIKNLNPIEAAIKLTRALEKSNKKELAKAEGTISETVGSETLAYALVNKFPNK